jgi:hypothetical protein
MKFVHFKYPIRRGLVVEAKGECMRRFDIMVALLLVLVCAAPSAAEYVISQSVIGSGGGSAAGGSYSVIGTVGQPAIGVTSGGSYIGEIGFWYQPGWVLTGVEEDGFPKSFSIGQNYPNPFNPVTTFAYSVPTRARVSIIIYDVSGREVRTLVDEQVEPGYHQTVLHATGLPSGVYFARMVAGSFIETRKITLLK